MTETRNYHREIVEERDRLRVERDELLKALKDCAEFFELTIGHLFGPGHDIPTAAHASVVISKVNAAIAHAEEGKS
jgi:hypothetical protein